MPTAKQITSFLKRKIAIGSELLPFLSDFITFKKLQKKTNSDAQFKMEISNLFPILSEKTSTTKFDRHYIFHTAWAARVVKKLNPKEHIDISSSLYFCSIVSAFLPVKFYDYRPADLSLSNLSSEAGDLMSLPFANNSIETISCMHVIEHIGLGRYGDPLDPNGDVKAINELKRVTQKNGYIIFVTPVGVPQIMFNAHRIYSYNQIIDRFSGCELVEFSLIKDSALGGSIVYNADPNLVAEQSYGCGLFVFKKHEFEKQVASPMHDLVPPQ